MFRKIKPSLSGVLYIIQGLPRCNISLNPSERQICKQQKGGLDELGDELNAI